MDDEDRCIMSRDIGVLPWRIDSFGVTLCHRPRLYWISWDLGEGEGVTVTPPESLDWYDFGEVHLNVAVDASEFLLSGCRLNTSEGLTHLSTEKQSQATGQQGCGSVLSLRRSSGVWMLIATRLINTGLRTLWSLPRVKGCLPSLKKK